MRSNRLLTIFLVVFVDLLGFSLILPLLPYYAEQYGANDLVVGIVAASYAAAQFLGAPLLGRLSDQYGRRPILLVSIAGTIAGFILLAITEPLGTAIGALLSARFGYAAPAWTAAGPATINWLAVFYWLPESTSPEHRAELTHRPRPIFSFGALGAAMNRPPVGLLFHINLPVLETSLVLAYIGLLAVCVQGLAIGRLSKRYTDRQLMLSAAIATAVGFALWAFVGNLWTPPLSGGDSL